MAYNYITLSQVMDDYLVTIDADDYVSGVNNTVLRNIARRGIREFGFDVTSIVKSLKVTVDSSNNTITLPEDYVDIVKLGIVGADGMVYVFGQNKSINYSQALALSGSKSESKKGPLSIKANETTDRVDSKTSTAGAEVLNSDDPFNSYVFRNYIFENNVGGLYGAGGGHLAGEYRINLDQNRIEIDTDNSTTQVVLEYISDAGIDPDPVIHVYAEEALRCYIYYKLCERKSNVPAYEKQRARQEYYNERRKAKARLSHFTKDEALRTIRKNFMQSPKY